MLPSSTKPSWRSALKVYFKAPVITMLFLGFSAGLPFLLVFSTLTTWLRTSGVDIAAIGFFSWVGLLYSIKFFWAPVIDNLKLPLLTRRLGKRRSWMLAGQLLIAGGLFGLSTLTPAGNLSTVALFALMVAFGSATQDIAIDAFRIESAHENLQAAMASIYIVGYRGGLIMAGAGALYIADSSSWQLAYLTMAACIGIGIITVLLRPEPARATQEVRLLNEPLVRRYLRSSHHHSRWRRRLVAWFIGAVACPFIDFFTRHGTKALAILIFIAIYRISDLAMASMAYPLYVDLGYSLDNIASITKVFGLLMTLAGGLVGGVLVARYGIAPLLIAGATATALTNLVFAFLAQVGGAEWTTMSLNQLFFGLASWPLLEGIFDVTIKTLLLILTITGDNLSNGLASAVFIAFLSSLTSRAYTATQFALFSSLMTLLGKFLSGFGGLVVASYGYMSFFIIASLLGIPAVLMAIWLSRDRELFGTQQTNN
ncbi:AmpG family muropeptide MFS transporter [Halomonas halocynthiae]|uniref:AmpG family muropeptide MFS transporter n=1 Tax=Halomonas halocynthiae TaxID=176290 RepID=UPI0003FB4507|nr:MFS transporter [Halomonas halocynthiae]